MEKWILTDNGSRKKDASFLPIGNVWMKTTLFLESEFTRNREIAFERERLHVLVWVLSPTNSISIDEFYKTITD